MPPAGIYDRIAGFSGIKKKICKWRSYYFVSGLYLGDAFVEYLFLGFLIILVQEKTGNSNLRRSAIISNAQDVFEQILASVLLFAIRHRIRPFYMILITYGSFFLGSLILWVTSNLSIGMIYFALVPLTVGEAGEGFTYLFLAELEREEQDEDKIETRLFICRFIARFFGAAIANFWISKLKWKRIFMSSAIVTGMGYLLFCFGFRYCSTEREDWDSSLLERRESNSRLLLRKLPLWFPFLFYYVVEAAGSTFFMEQTDKLNDRIGKTFHVPRPSSFLAVQTCAKFIASSLADCLIKKFCKDDNRERCGTLVRMSLGMFACSGCCVVAWRFETHRLHLINGHRGSDLIPMSILLLAPQFSLLGIADGLVDNGMQDFFYDHAPVSMRHFEMAFNAAVDALGKLIAVVFILVLRNWIRNSINESHLDSYYCMLAILIFCVIVLFIFLANIYVRLGH